MLECAAGCGSMGWWAWYSSTKVTDSGNRKVGLGAVLRWCTMQAALRAIEPIAAIATTRGFGNDARGTRMYQWTWISWRWMNEI